MPHAAGNSCQPAGAAMQQNPDNVCRNDADGALVANPADCSAFMVCLHGAVISEQKCPLGSFFQTTSGYCLPNDGSCKVPLTGECENAKENTLLPYAEDCTAYYNCSTVGTLVQQCPEGQYFHAFTKQCRIDHGICKQPVAEAKRKCVGVPPGTCLMHELYCNIYYSCQRGRAVPLECPNGQLFNNILGKCIEDEQQQCENGQLLFGNQSSCGGSQIAGSYLSDRLNCRQYYICAENGAALQQKCAKGSYFNVEQLLCLPDDGSCSVADDDDDDDEPQNHPVPPDPIVCVGKHGFMMPDQANCNNFYICINSNLRRERCYSGHNFNGSSYQCQAYANHSSNNK